MSGSGPQNAGKIVVVVDALHVDHMNLKPRDSVVSDEFGGRGAGDVLDEGGVIESLHRDMPLIGALEQGIQRGRGRGLGALDEVFDPDDVRLPSGVVGAANLKFHVSTLVVGPVVADFLAARAEAGNWNIHAYDKISVLAIDVALEVAGVVHQRLGSADGSCPLQKVGELSPDMGALSVESSLEVA